MSQDRETIVALATPVGTAAIAVVRMSGPASFEISVAATGGKPLVPRRAHHRDYLNVAGTLLDDVVVTFFKGPHSYTGEDSAEISCHGNPLLVQLVIEDLVARGCRAAQPGEFTRRAFVGGRIDLSQAEAVMDLIHARSESALNAANQQLRGRLSEEITRITRHLVAALARVEAYIDFPEEDLPAEDKGFITESIAGARAQIKELLATMRYGQLLRDGFKTVIIGEPNVGKSSLLNRLLGMDRALVSPEPGTTRDFIEEGLAVGSFNLRLVDTAGLNAAPAPLELLGMEKGIEKAMDADLFLWVWDVSSPTPAQLPAPIFARLVKENTVIVLNKADLGRRVEQDMTSVEKFPRVELSALSGQGLSELRRLLEVKAQAMSGNIGSDKVSVNVRHAAAIGAADSCIHRAQEQLVAAAGSELVASELRAALHELGAIQGRFDFETVLDEIFGNFCIGK